MEFSLIVQEDLDIGGGTRDLRLQDGAIHTLHQISLPSFLIARTQTLPCTNNAAVLTASLIPIGARLAGVTTKNIGTLGTSNGLTAYLIGDSGGVDDRWGTQDDLTANAETDQSFFSSGDWPLFPTGGDVLLRPTPGLFDGTGSIEVTAYYFFLRHRTA